ncbi:hypothetical protein FHS56_000192 [Thermonema lapsum]|uniref:Glycosyltransferase n=1 Tax=Thermonema lapsum TaxID=28195 RepID=A0A846MME6_9BACT|nr:hypothetical protein [Thermonema lapsum]NIK72706.1 hypothetical protein [Thermonema lapsum]
MKETPKIKVGFLVSYDWPLLRYSLPLVYNGADEIYLALDRKRLTWAGKPFAFDEDVFGDLLKSIDFDGKVHLYEDDFFVPGLTPIECDGRERNLLAKAMGEGGWHVQIDADEYFLNFDDFCSFLRKQDLHQKEVNYSVLLINLFKKLPDGYLYITGGSPELAPVATNKPCYHYARRNGYFNKIAPFFVLHDTWARPEEELWQKITNWGHRDDFDAVSYFNFWKELNSTNYHTVRDFHPLEPSVWHRLEFIEASTIEELFERFSAMPFPLGTWQLRLKNNRNIARIKHLWHKVRNLWNS